MPCATTTVTEFSPLTGRGDAHRRRYTGRVVSPVVMKEYGTGVFAYPQTACGEEKKQHTTQAVYARRKHTFATVVLFFQHRRFTLRANTPVPHL